MLRGFTLSVVIILLLSSGAFALIGQLQCGDVGSTMTLASPGWGGMATSSVILPFGQNQYKHDMASNTTVFQTQNGLIAQGATAVGGLFGSSGVVQGVEASGLQGQLVADPLTLQGEMMTVGLNQTASSLGIGDVQAFQAFIGGQSQIVSSPAGVSAQSQTVAATQYSAVVGGPCSVGVATNNITVDMLQLQLSQTPSGPAGPPPGPN